MRSWGVCGASVESHACLIILFDSSVGYCLVLKRRRASGSQRRFQFFILGRPCRVAYTSQLMNGGKVLSQASVSLPESSASDGRVMPAWSDSTVLLRRGADGREVSPSSAWLVSAAIDGTLPDVVCRRAVFRGRGDPSTVALRAVDEKFIASICPGGAYRVPAGVSFLPAFSAFFTSARNGRASACLYPSG